MAEDSQPSAREEQARRLAETLRRQLGATLCGLMQAPDVVELILNPDGRVWVDRLGQGMSSVCMMAPATTRLGMAQAWPEAAAFTAKKVTAFARRPASNGGSPTPAKTN